VRQLTLLCRGVLSDERRIKMSNLETGTMKRKGGMRGEKKVWW